MEIVDILVGGYYRSVAHIFVLAYIKRCLEVLCNMLVNILISETFTLNICICISPNV